MALAAARFVGRPSPRKALSRTAAPRRTDGPVGVSADFPPQGADGRERLFQLWIIRSRLCFPDSLFAVGQLKRRRGAVGGAQSPSARGRAVPSRAARRPPPPLCHCSPSPLRCCPLPPVAARCSSALRCAALRGAFGPAAPTGPRLIGTAPGGGGWGIGAESISGSQMPPRHPRRWLKTISIVQFDCLNQTDLQQIHLSFDKSITVSFR